MATPNIQSGSKHDYILHKALMKKHLQINFVKNKIPYLSNYIVTQTIKNNKDMK